MMPEKTEISVILPVYNEEDKIEKTIRLTDFVMKNLGRKYEIIIVDDGSTDATRLRIINYTKTKNHIKLLTHEENFGKGRALRDGFKCAKGDIIIYIDGDLDISPLQIPQYVNAVLSGNDLVIASKWHPDSCVSMHLARKFLNCVFNVLVKLLLRLRYRDTQTGLKAFKRKKIEKILPKFFVDGYAFDVELLSVAKHYGLKVAELPVEAMIYDNISFNEILNMLIDILKISYRLRISKAYFITDR